VVFPHTTPDGRLVNLYGRAVGTAEQVPKAKRHDHLPGEKGYFNAAALQAGSGPLWVCEGAFDALALLAAGVPRVVAIFGVQGWRWDWVREVRERACSHFSGQASSRARGEVAIRFNRFHRPALSYDRNRSMASALARHQKRLGPFKRRLTTRRTVLSSAPLPIGSFMATSWAYAMRPWFLMK
jgi:hypothetical protein